jgi:hypothetical protein
MASVHPVLHSLAFILLYVVLHARPATTCIMYQVLNFNMRCRCIVVIYVLICNLSSQ